MKWLKANNILYKDIVLNDEWAIPDVIECHRIEGSSGSNIDTVFGVTSIFPDSNEPMDINGG